MSCRSYTDANRVGRRILLPSLVALSLLPAPGGQVPKAQAPERVVLFASIGAELTQYDVDVAKAQLTRRSAVTLPANVIEAVGHPSKNFLYVAWSNRSIAANGSVSGGTRHGLSAFRIDSSSGNLTPQGPSVPLPSRPFHLTIDRDGTHVLVAYIDPSGVTVHCIEPDGSIGIVVEPAPPLDVGVYAHQVRVAPSNKIVVLVTRGKGGTEGKPLEPGALKVFRYDDGKLTNLTSIAPDGGRNYQARSLDYHPSRPWVFLSLERQNKLEVYQELDNGSLSKTPLFVKDTLAEPGNVRLGQGAGTIHVHPNGKVVYLVNRATGTTDFNGKPVFVGGENSIAVFGIDQFSGEPTLIQSIDSRGIHPQAFALDSRGRILVVGNQLSLSVREGEHTNTSAPNVAVFRVRGDGKLDFAAKYDINGLFWVGLVSLHEPSE
jgi:6-phosphogluconolactonase